MINQAKTNRTFSIKLPWRMATSKGAYKSKKSWDPVNMNVYRNLHHRQLAFQKKAYAETIKPLLKNIPKLGVITLDYTIFPKRKGRLDTANVCSVSDKYFSDCLVENGIIPDDDYTNIQRVSFCFGEVSPDEYVLVTITEIQPPKETENSMKIFLDTDEITAAVNNYVNDLELPGVKSVELKADDKGNVTAEIVTETATSSEEDEPKPKKRMGRPAGSKNKPKEPDDVETVSPSSSTGDDSGASESTDSKDEVSTEGQEGKESKNPSKESQEGSSAQTETNETEEEVSSAEAKPVAKKKTSIFSV